MKQRRLTNDDSAKETSIMQELDETGLFSRLRPNLDINESKLIPETKLKWDSEVALLVEKDIELMNGEIVKLVPGQVGSLDLSDSSEPYLVNFYDQDKIPPFDKITDQDDITNPIFIWALLYRNEFFVLNNDYNRSSSTSKTVDTSKNLKQENSPCVTDISATDIEKVLKQIAKSVNDSLSTQFKNSFEPGNLVTVTADFTEEKDDTFQIKICAGYIGLILDPDKDEIIDENNKVVLNIKEYLEEDEILVYFRMLHLWHLFDLSKYGYNRIAFFEKNDCYIFNKAFLLPLCFKQHLPS